MQPSPFKLLPALLAVAIFAQPVSASEKILFGHLFEESTAHHQKALWAAGETEKRTNGRYVIEVLGKGTLGSSFRFIIPIIQPIVERFWYYNEVSASTVISNGERNLRAHP
jgi:hypothetical protein